MDIVEQAKEFGINAHSRINHRRKYTKQPYSVHLSAVAKLVASATDDPEPIAAAWLHDVVEDTSATLLDVERAFGKTIASLVDDLTDVSRPSDGNRATRKKMDLKHLKKASPKAQTVKLADLIDNCEDITKNDLRFAEVYLIEMEALLEILTAGDSNLYKQAQEAHERCSKRVKKQKHKKTSQEEAVGFLYQRLDERTRLLRLIMKTFIAHDIAEPLRSFDINKPCSHVLEIMDELGLDLVCLRERGKISGYALRQDLQQKKDMCGDHLRPFHQGQVIQDDSRLVEVIHVLTLHKYAFLRTLGDIVGYISRNEVNKPEFRMWLFGIITFIEIEFTHIIKQKYTDDSWQSLISENRLQKARELHKERERRGHKCDLIDCLQYADKGRILINNDEIMTQMQLPSRKMAKQVTKELESLRNNLAHSQDIVSHNWEPIARMAYNLEYSANLAGK